MNHGGRRLRPLVFGVALAACMAFAGIEGQAQAPTVPVLGSCQDGVLPSGALSRTCYPLAWNGQVIVFAHGFVPPFAPIGFYNLTLPDGTSIPDLVQSLGFAFATTSYRQNGLTILEGVDDLAELADTLPLVPRWLAGVSEGALMAVLSGEKASPKFTGAFAACGPVGDFRREIDYLGDFRVLFDYFYPGVIPGSAVDIPNAVIGAWTTYYVPLISGLMAKDPARALRLLKTAKAPYDPSKPATIVQTSINLLTYNIYATNDAALKLGGNPYDNRFRWYWGSGADLRLNLGVKRYAASPTALHALQPYITTGNLAIPVVGLHTTGDEIVPFGQELLYWAKVTFGGTGTFVPLPVARYGHCNFTSQELLASLHLLLQQYP